MDAIYSYRGTDAVRHLFSVASGLDSMIVGEAEIQGQVKRSYELALVEGFDRPDARTGSSATRSPPASASGPRPRSAGRARRSRPSRSAGGRDAGRPGRAARARWIGAGENGELTARALRERGVETVFVANRRYDRAIGLAERFGGRAIRFDDLPGELVRADIVVSSTGSPHQIVGREEMELVARERDGRPLVLIDIAVPRDIDPTVRDLAGIALYDMDDLQRAVAQNISVREAEAAKSAHDRRPRGRAVRGLAREPRRRPDDRGAARARRRDRRAGAARERAALGERGPRPTASGSGCSRGRSSGRMLHEPTLRLKGAVGDEDAYHYVHALRNLFGLDPAAASLEAERPPAAEVTDLRARRRGRGG